MKDIINCTIKKIESPNIASVKIVSYGFYNEYDFENRNELLIEFSNLSDENSLVNIGNKPLQIIVEYEPSNLDLPIIGRGQVFQLINSKMFLK